MIKPNCLDLTLHNIFHSQVLNSQMSCLFVFKKSSENSTTASNKCHHPHSNLLISKDVNKLTWCYKFKDPNLKIPHCLQYLMFRNHDWRQTLNNNWFVMHTHTLMLNLHRWERIKIETHRFNHRNEIFFVLLIHAFIKILIETY